MRVARGLWTPVPPPVLSQIQPLERWWLWTFATGYGKLLKDFEQENDAACLILERSHWWLCVKDGYEMNKTEAKTVRFHQGRVKRWKEVERAKERPPPRKGVKVRMFQMVEREPERCNVRKAQGRGECIQYGLNHLGMERKVHMPNKSLWNNLGHSFLHHLVRWNEELPTMFQLFICFQLSSLGNLNSFNLLLKVLFSFSSIIFIALSGNLPTVSTSCLSCQTQTWRGF